MKSKKVILLEDWLNTEDYDSASFPVRSAVTGP